MNEEPVDQLERKEDEDIAADEELKRGVPHPGNDHELDNRQLLNTCDVG